MRRLLTTTNLVLVTAVVLGGFGLSGCATEKYVDEHIAAVNTRIDGVDAKAVDHRGDIGDQLGEPISRTICRR